jgi:hypothetical protein
MTDRQVSKLNMYQKVLNVCEENEQEYANVQIFTQSVGELRHQVLEIKSVTQQQSEAKTKGATKDKSSAIDRLVEMVLRIANPLYVYAINTEDNRLREKVNVNKSFFYHTHNQIALTFAKTVAAEANTLGDELNNYGISSADRAELDAAITQFENLINAPAGIAGERKLRTDSLRELFVTADSVVYDKLDKLITLFKTSSPEFYALYGNARNIVNTAARKRKEKKE